MHVSRVALRGFRGISCDVRLSAPLSVIVGANNVGKSNIVDALRTVLWPVDGPRARRWIRADDFAISRSGERASSFSVEVEFGNLDDEDEAAMITCLGSKPRTAILRLEASRDDRARVHTSVTGGDAGHGEVDRFAREAVQWMYLPPLRDAARDLRPGPTNRAANLLRTLVPHGHPDREAMERIVDAANIDLDGVASMITAEGSIANHLLAMSGPVLVQASDLLFAPADFEAIIRTLRGHAGDNPALDLERNGLGYNNLLYMATLLAAIQRESDARLTVLLVEEPEAHLHPQLQDLLLRFLEDPAGQLRAAEERRGDGDSDSDSDSDQDGHSDGVKAPEPKGKEPRQFVQSVVTSHSPNVVATAGAERVSVVSRHASKEQVVSRSPSEFGMDQTDLDHLGRYLDVTKAALLFARGVILVEGIAEQLIVPAFARQSGRSLSDFGVTVVNVDGLAFGPFVELFADGRLPIRCALITDGDATVEELDGSDPALSASTSSLIARVRDWTNVEIFYGATTLEKELGSQCDWNVLLDALGRIHGQVAARLRDADIHDRQARGEKLLAAVERRKGRFAQALAAHLDEGHKLTPPDYIARAIEYACTEPDLNGKPSSSARRTDA